MAAAAAPPIDTDVMVRIVEDLRAHVGEQMTVHPVLVVLEYFFLRLSGLRDRLVRFVARVRAGKKPRDPAARSGAGDGEVKPRVRKPILWPRKWGALAE